MTKEPPANKESERNIMEEIVPPFIENKFVVTNFSKKKK